MLATTPANLELSIAPFGLGLGLTLRLGEPDIRHGPFAVSLDEAALRGVSLDTQAYGIALRDALFADPMAAAAYRECRAAVLRGGQQLRLRLALPHSLQPIRWETLCDPVSGRAVACDGDIWFSRYLSGRDYQPVQRRFRRQLNVLVVVAAPQDADAYGLALMNVEAELERIARSLGLLPFTVLGADSNTLATWEHLIGALRQGYDLVYLIAHGALIDGQAWIYLVNGQGEATPQLGADLGDVVHSLGPRRPSLALLASCQSSGDSYAKTMASLGPLLAQAGLPAVIAMQGNISTATHERFAPTFFHELLLDGQVDRAVNAARLAVQTLPDWWMPVLYTRLADGFLWAHERSEAEPTRLDQNESGARRKKGRLEQRRSILMQEWEIRQEKLLRLRQACSIETNPAILFQLERHVLLEEREIESLDQQIVRIEAELELLG